MKNFLSIVAKNDTTQLNENVEECGMDMPPAPTPEPDPVTMSVNLNARGVDKIKDLLSLISDADKATNPGPDYNGDGQLDPHEKDHAKEIPVIKSLDKDGDMDHDMKDHGKEMPIMIAAAEEYDNEPDEEYGDIEMMIKDLAGGLNREKKSFKAAQAGDNAMAVQEMLKAELANDYKLFLEGKKEKKSDKKEELPTYEITLEKDGKEKTIEEKAKEGEKLGDVEDRVREDNNWRGYTISSIKKMKDD